MSMFFFRLHNLRREEESKKQRQQQQRVSRQRRTLGCPTMRFPNNLTLAPSRLFERTPLTPSDSLDEVALQIPRYNSIYSTTRTAARQGGRAAVRQGGMAVRLVAWCSFDVLLARCSVGAWPATGLEFGSNAIV